MRTQHCVHDTHLHVLRELKYEAPTCCSSIIMIPGCTRSICDASASGPCTNTNSHRKSTKQRTNCMQQGRAKCMRYKDHAYGMSASGIWCPMADVKGREAAVATGTVGKCDIMQHEATARMTARHSCSQLIYIPSIATSLSCTPSPRTTSPPFHPLPAAHTLPVFPRQPSNPNTTAHCQTFPVTPAPKHAQT